MNPKSGRRVPAQHHTEGLAGELQIRGWPPCLDRRRHRTLEAFLADTPQHCMRPSTGPIAPRRTTTATCLVRQVTAGRDGRSPRGANKGEHGRGKPTPQRCGHAHAVTATGDPLDDWAQTPHPGSLGTSPWRGSTGEYAARPASKDPFRGCQDSLRADRLLRTTMTWLAIVATSKRAARMAMSVSWDTQPDL